MIEVQVINACLSKRDIQWLRLNDIDEKFFSVYSAEFKFILDHENKYGNVPDITTFAEKFKDFPIGEVFESEFYLIDKLREEYTYNQSAEVLNDIAKRLKNGEDSRDVVSYMLSKIPDLNKNLVFEAHDLIRDFEKRYKKYEERSENPDKAFIKFGLPELDAVVGGIDRSNELGVITASTGQGKSWWAIFVGLSAAKQGYTVGYYSGEMDEELVGWRLDTEYSHISNFALTRGNKYIKEDYRKHLENMRKSVPGKFYCVTPEDFGELPTVGRLGSFVDKYKLDLLIIDQLSLIQDSGPLKKRNEAYENISKELKVLQTSKRVPIISVVQLNRGAQEKDVEDPGTNHISGSNRISEDASIAISIKQKQPNTLELRVMKGRNCPTGSKLTYNWAVDTFDLVYVKTGDDLYSKHLEQMEKKGFKKQEEPEKNVYSDDFGGGDVF